MTDLASFSYEQGLKQLEGIVHALEQGNLPIEEALAQFEQGVQLSRRCQEILQQVTQKVALLSRDPEGKYLETPFKLAEAQEQE